MTAPVFVAPQFVAAFGNSIAIGVGQFRGDIATGDGTVIVGQLIEPVNGRISVSVNGAEPWVFQAGTLDVDQSGFVDGADYDRWMEAWVQGSPLADYLGTGFTNGDSFDAFMADWQAGIQGH